MPMPHLLKQLSEKSLRKRFQTSKPVDEKISPPWLSEPLPPLPPPKNPPWSDRSFRTMTPTSSLETLDTPSPLFHVTNGTESTRTSWRSGGIWTPPSPVSGPKDTHDDLSDEISVAWDVVDKESKTDKVLRKIEGEARSAKGHKEHVSIAIDGIDGFTATFEGTGAVQAIEQGVNHFLDGTSALINALHEVSKLHPFIGVAVMAFKAVYTLEMKRRENDRRIITLHIEMKEMMGVLVQLKNVRDAEEIAPDGSSIKGRMENLVHGTADDIKACANACDTYSKKKPVVKVLKGPVWEARLLKFVSLFTKRRSEFEFALAIHTSLGVDAANKTLGSVEKTTQEMNAKMDMMMMMFQNFTSPEEKDIARLVKQKGGTKACEGNDKFLKELIESEPKTGSPATGPSHGGRKAGPKPSDFEDLKDDLHVDPDVAMEKNMEVFSRKFEVQKRQIVEDVERAVKREGDRVISAVTAGPHDKIVDPDVHKIWKEMGWKGSVKTRHFVMALRDYFREKWDSEGHPDDGTAELVADNRRSDEWALAYLNVVRLQPISEAFDDDASGFVTVAEVNTFTTSRPISWSLPHWIAYWAIGWHQSLFAYAGKIRDIVSKMFAILPAIRLENRASVNEYLSSIYQNVTSLERPVATCYISADLEARFNSYIEAEEARLHHNLDAVRYDIDAEDTLALVTGPGRIERFALPILYLLLKRHFEIFRICRTRTISDEELPDAVGTLEYIFDEVNDRVDVLQTIFKQQKLDARKQFKTFAHGSFEYWDEPKLLWDPAIVRASDIPEYPYDDSGEEKDIKAEDILNHGVELGELEFSAYEPQTQGRSVVFANMPLPLGAVLGLWSGYTYGLPSDPFPLTGMISMSLCPCTPEGWDQRFRASGRSSGTDFTISGECGFDQTDDSIDISFKREFRNGYPAEYWYGRLDRVAETITGTWGHDVDRIAHRAPFILKRTPPEYLCFRPAPAAFEAQQASALWSFALSAVRYHVRRNSWSWSFFSERRDNRKRFIELYIRENEFGRALVDSETRELRRVRQTFTTADYGFYLSLAQYKIRRRINHNVICDNCKGPIGGARIICLACQMKGAWHSVDLCDAPGCVAADVNRGDLTRPHLRTHDIMKVRQVVHIRQLGKLDREAKEALEHARAAFGRDQTQGSRENGAERGSAESDEECDHNDSGYDSSPIAVVAQKRVSRKVEAGITCAACRQPVTRPCWYCVQCEDDVFICDDCDAKGCASFENRKHAGIHDLVRCQRHVEDKEITMEDRLLERFAKHERTVNKKLAQLNSKVDDRLSRVETLLEAVLGKIGVPPV